MRPRVHARGFFKDDMENEEELRKILKAVSEHSISTEDALLSIREKPYEDIGFAKIDMERGVRQGAGEVIYGAGKSAEQITGICVKMLEKGRKRILITRIDKNKADALKSAVTGLASFYYNKDSNTAIVGEMPESSAKGKIVVATGGTSDIPVSEEAALTAEFLGNSVVRLYDVGVSGLQRLLSHVDDIMSARVIIVVAGMEGALASVIGGLADCPVIAVPTSVGYGASFHGLSALLSMLNSCASGVSVVNIDNGFGAGYQASMINHIGEEKE